MLTPYELYAIGVCGLVVVIYGCRAYWTIKIGNLQLRWTELGRRHFARGYPGVEETIAEVDHALIEGSQELNLLHYATIDDEHGPTDYVVLSHNRFLHNDSDLDQAIRWIVGNKRGAITKVKVTYTGARSSLMGIENMDMWEDRVFLNINGVQLGLYRHPFRPDFLLVWIQGGKKYYTICREGELYQRQQAAVRAAFEEHPPVGDKWHEVNKQAA